MTLTKPRGPEPEIRQALSDLCEYSRHFNGLCMTIRGFASTWLLAGAVGIGILEHDFSSGLTTHRGCPREVASLIALATGLGVFLAWMLDQRVYQRLLGGVTGTALAFERRNPAVPQLHLAFRQRLPKGATVLVCSFYVSLLLFIDAFCFFEFVLFPGLSAGVLTFAAEAILALAAIYMSWRSLGGTRDLYFNKPQLAAQIAKVRCRPSSDASTARAPRIVITGGGGAGKTTLCNALKTRIPRIYLVPESAEDVFRFLGALTGDTNGSEIRKYRVDHPGIVQGLIAQAQLVRESEALEQHGIDVPILFDRGLTDGLAYCRSAKISENPVLLEYAGSRPYTHIFVLEPPPARDFVERPLTGRKSTRDESAVMSALLDDTYRALNYDVHLLPWSSVETQAALVSKIAGLEGI